MIAPREPQKLGVGMAVCRQDRAYRDYALSSNPIPDLVQPRVEANITY